MEKSKYGRAIGRKWFRRGNPKRMLPPHGGQKYVLSPRGVMAIDFPQKQGCGSGYFSNAFTNKKRPLTIFLTFVGLQPAFYTLSF